MWCLKVFFFFFFVGVNQCWCLKVFYRRGSPMWFLKVFRIEVTNVGFKDFYEASG